MVDFLYNMTLNASDNPCLMPGYEYYDFFNEFNMDCLSGANFRSSSTDQDSTEIATISPDCFQTLIDAQNQHLLNMYQENKWTPFAVCLVVLYSLTFIVGLVGNTLVIVVVAKHHTMRSVTNTFLVNLSVGDLLVVIICMPLTLSPYIHKNWIYGEVACKMTPFLQGTSVGVSVLTLLTISLDRFYAIHNPMKARLFFSKRRVKIIIALIWIFAMAISSPLIATNKVVTHSLFSRKMTIKYCQEIWNPKEARNIFNITVFVLLYVLPVGGMVIAYAKIASTLWTGDSRLYQRDNNSMSQQTKNVLRCRRRIVKMLIFVVISFAVSWIPYHVINIYLDFTYKTTDVLSYTGSIAVYTYPIVQWFGLTNSSTNPVFYCFFSKGFRKAFQKFCCCCINSFNIFRDTSSTDGTAFVTRRLESFRRSTKSPSPMINDSAFSRIFKSKHTRQAHNNSLTFPLDTHARSTEAEQKQKCFDSNVKNGNILFHSNNHEGIRLGSDPSITHAQCGLGADVIYPINKIISETVL